jgi:predicted small lipoprotein YifL
MGIEQIILVRASALCANVASVAIAAALLSGCGQKGPLTLPNDPEFKQRATLPDIVRRQLPGSPSPTSATTPATNTTSPAPAASSPAGR